MFVLGGADLNASLQEGSVFNADALGDDVSRQRTLATDIQAVNALDVAGYFAHDHNFAGADIRGDDAVASDGDAVVGKIDGALDLAIDVQRFRSGDLALDYQLAADGCLLHWRADSLDRVERIWVRGKLRLLRIVF